MFLIIFFKIKDKLFVNAKLDLTAIIYSDAQNLRNVKMISSLTSGSQPVPFLPLVELWIVNIIISSADSPDTHSKLNHIYSFTKWP